MRISKLIGLIAAFAALAVAGPALAKSDHANNGKGKEKSTQAKQKGLQHRVCQIERKELGRSDFRAKYGDGDKGNHAMRNCKRINRTKVKHAKHAAVSDCRDERDAIGKDAFVEKYGTNKNGHNAFGKCVSQSVKNAAKECRAEQKDLGDDEFTAKYGTNKNGRNAFGKCVVKTVKANDNTDGTTA